MWVYGWHHHHHMISWMMLMWWLMLTWRRRAMTHGRMNCVGIFHTRGIFHCELDWILTSPPPCTQLRPKFDDKQNWTGLRPLTMNCVGIFHNLPWTDSAPWTVSEFSTHAEFSTVNWTAKGQGQTLASSSYDIAAEVRDADVVTHAHLTARGYDSWSCDGEGLWLIRSREWAWPNSHVIKWGAVIGHYDETGHSYLLTKIHIVA